MRLVLLSFVGASCFIVFCCQGEEILHLGRKLHVLSFRMGLGTKLVINSWRADVDHLASDH